MTQCPSFMTLQILSPRLTSQRHICPLVRGNPHHERITCNQCPLIGVRSYLRVTCLAHTRHCVLSSITQQDTSHCMLCLDFTTYSAGKKFVFMVQADQNVLFLSQQRKQEHTAHKRYSTGQSNSIGDKKLYCSLFKHLWQ